MSDQKSNHGDELYVYTVPDIVYRVFRERLSVPVNESAYKYSNLSVQL